MDAKRILGWFFIPYIMVFIDWKKSHVALKIYGIFSASIFAFLILSILMVDVPKETNQIEKEKNIVAETPLYPEDVLKTIQELSKSDMTKNEKYTTFETKLIGLNPTKKQMLKHKNIVVDAYKKLSFDGINSLDDETLLKQIYSARIVDFYYAFDDVGNSTGLFAFNYIQIAKDAYRDILEKENYNINKMQLDKHFANMQ